MYRPGIMRCRLHTGGKTVAEIKERYRCRQTLEAEKEREYLKTVEREPGPLFREDGNAEEGAGE